MFPRLRVLDPGPQWYTASVSTTSSVGGGRLRVRAASISQKFRGVLSIPTNGDPTLCEFAAAYRQRVGNICQLHLGVLRNM